VEGIEMTKASAKLYKTAVLTQDASPYKAGDIVAVQFIGRGSFGLNFRISYPDMPTIVVADSYLEGFVL
jgi:hypothetical protein